VSVLTFETPPQLMLSTKAFRKVQKSCRKGINEIVSSWFAFLCVLEKLAEKRRPHPGYIAISSAIWMSQISKAATEVTAITSLLKQTPPAVARLAQGSLWLRVQALAAESNRRSAAIRGPAYNSFNSSPRT
jgi:hypothetical protein